MPQFDLFSFFVQVFYVTLSFLVFYLLNEFYFLVRVSRALKARRKSIELLGQYMAQENERKKALYSAVIKLAIMK